MSLLPQSTAVRITFDAYLASDHLTPATGLTIAVTISKNGAAYANPNAGATNATEASQGTYYVDLDTTDTATLGPLKVRGTQATIDTVKTPEYRIVKATNAGFTGIADAVAGAASGLAIVGSNMGTAASVVGNVAGNVVGSVGSVVGAVGSVTGAVGSVTGNVGGNVTGSVGSVVGAVGSVTGAVGSVTGSVGGNVVGSVGSVVGAVGSVTGNVGGNLTGSVGSLATQAKADVNAEVVDVVSVDTWPEPTGVPTATTTIVGKLGRLYQVMRNKLTVTATAKTLMDDAGSPLWKKVLSDDGTVYTEDEGATP